jgi:hypothetical protein
MQVNSTILVMIISYLQLQQIFKVFNLIDPDNRGYHNEALTPKRPGWYFLRMVPHLEEVYKVDRPSQHGLSIMQIALEADWNKVLPR